MGASVALAALPEKITGQVVGHSVHCTLTLVPGSDSNDESEIRYWTNAKAIVTLARCPWPSSRLFLPGHYTWVLCNVSQVVTLGNPKTGIIPPPKVPAATV